MLLSSLSGSSLSGGSTFSISWNFSCLSLVSFNFLFNTLSLLFIFFTKNLDFLILICVAFTLSRKKLQEHLLGIFFLFSTPRKSLGRKDSLSLFVTCRKRRYVFFFSFPALSLTVLLELTRKERCVVGILCRNATQNAFGFV